MRETSLSFQVPSDVECESAEGYKRARKSFDLSKIRAKSLKIWAKSLKNEEQRKNNSDNTRQTP